MANTRSKVPRKDNPRPKLPSLGPKSTRLDQNENPAIEKDDHPVIAQANDATQNANTKQSRGGRGHAKKATVVDHQTNQLNAEQDSEPAPTQAAPRKRGRKAETPADDAGIQPPSKRAKAVEPTSRDPLPDRPGRNLHPAGKLPKRRTTQEVAAERDAKARAIEKRIQELEDAKRQLERLSAATRKRSYAELEGHSDDGETFDFSDVDAMLDLSDEELDILAQES